MLICLPKNIVQNECDHTALDIEFHLDVFFAISQKLCVDAISRDKLCAGTYVLMAILWPIVSYITNFNQIVM